MTELDLLGITAVAPFFNLFVNLSTVTEFHRPKQEGKSRHGQLTRSR